jgi:hypothetical protein
LSDNEYDSIEALISESGGRGNKLLEDWNKLSSILGKDRSYIARLIICLYCAVVVTIALYLCYRGVFGNENVAGDLAELLKIGVLPIVTLVIGFYFGSSRPE